jgi:hypothetical protein
VQQTTSSEYESVDFFSDLSVVNDPIPSIDSFGGARPRERRFEYDPAEPAAGSSSAVEGFTDLEVEIVRALDNVPTVRYNFGGRLDDAPSPGGWGMGPALRAFRSWTSVAR